MSSYEAIEILLVEDNPDDVEITQRALGKIRLANRLHVVRDGEEALKFLRHQGEFEDHAESPRPDLILLDLNLPKVNGKEVLAAIRHDENLATIPVIMLTASSRDEDVVESYRLGTNTFIQKPVEFDKFLHALDVIGEYWMVIAKLPPNADRRAA